MNILCLKGKGLQDKRSRLTLRFAKVLWFFWGLLILCRAVYDFHLYFHGDLVAVRDRKTYDFLIHFPPGYSDFGHAHPLLIFLHGVGETGLDVREMDQFDPFHFAEGHVSRHEMPFILISPVLPAGHEWRPDRIKALIESLLQHPRRLNIDPSRVYLTGYSMGGFAAFDTAEEFPELFAAVAPVAGGGDRSRAELLKDLPIRAYHGDSDEVVSYRHSQEMIDAIQAAGNCEARLIMIQGGNHHICADVYGNSDIYSWLLKHRNRFSR